MKNITILIKPASSLCNMRCAYCFYADVASLREVRSYGVMSNETAHLLIDNVCANLSRDDEATFVFQGGEPTLAGFDFFRDFVSYAEKKFSSRKVHFSLQTNGILIDEAWCEFLHDKNFLVGLSLDAEQIFHDANRVDAKGCGTFERVIQTKKLFEKFHVEYNVLRVLTKQLAENPKRVWNFLVHNNIKFVQFVPCLAELGDDAATAETSRIAEASPLAKNTHSAKAAHSADTFALSPRGFAKFYNALFPLWKERFEKGKYISVKFFDDIFNLLVRRVVSACGFTGECHPQIVVEAAGSVFPCDFYVLDKWKCGNITRNTLDNLATCNVAKKFSARERTSGKVCEKCGYRNFCGGGCPRMRNAMYLDAAEKFCGYKNFLDTNKTEIEKIAVKI